MTHFRSEEKIFIRCESKSDITKWVSSIDEKLTNWIVSRNLFFSDLEKIK